MTHGPVFRRNNYSGICKIDLQIREIDTFPRESKNVLSGAWITFNYIHASLSKSLCQSHSASGKSLHTGYEAGIDIDSSFLQDSLNLTDNPESTTSAVIPCTGSPSWER